MKGRCCWERVLTWIQCEFFGGNNAKNRRRSFHMPSNPRDVIILPLIWFSLQFSVLCDFGKRFFICILHGTILDSNVKHTNHNQASAIVESTYTSCQRRRFTVDLLSVEMQRGENARCALVMRDPKAGGVPRRLIRAETGEQSMKRRRLWFHRRLG